MHDQGFLGRLKEVGPGPIIKSVDFILAVVAFFIIYIAKDGAFSQQAAEPLLTTISRISASLFAIILTGLTIITSFTDKQFIYAWKKLDEFDEIMTLFEYYLYLPLIVLLASLSLEYLRYDGTAMVLVAALFVYMVLGMFSLVGFIVKYGLQRAKFIEDQIDAEQNPTITMADLEEIASQQGYKLVDEDRKVLSNEELERIRDELDDKTGSE